MSSMIAEINQLLATSKAEVQIAALSQLQSYTKTADFASQVLAESKGAFIEHLASFLLPPTHQALAQLSALSLLNLSAHEGVTPRILQTRAVHELLRLLGESQTGPKSREIFAVSLSNLTASAEGAAQLIDLEDGVETPTCSRSLFKAVLLDFIRASKDAASQVSSPSSSSSSSASAPALPSSKFVSNLLANVSQLDDGHTFLCSAVANASAKQDSSLLGQCISACFSHSDVVRRHGTLATLRNVLFKRDLHKQFATSRLVGMITNRLRAESSEDGREETLTLRKMCADCLYLMTRSQIGLETLCFFQEDIEYEAAEDKDAEIKEKMGALVERLVSFRKAIGESQQEQQIEGFELTTERPEGYESSDDEAEIGPDQIHEAAASDSVEPWKSLSHGLPEEEAVDMVPFYQDDSPAQDP